MGFSKLFESMLAFLDNSRLIAWSYIVLLVKWASSDACEAQTVLDACRQLGFFFLESSEDIVGMRLIREIDAIFEIVRETMSLALEEKLKVQ